MWRSLVLWWIRHTRVVPLLRRPLADCQPQDPKQSCFCTSMRAQRYPPIGVQISRGTCSPAPASPRRSAHLTPPHPPRLMPHPFWYRLILLPVGCLDRLAETVRFVSPRDSPERGAPLHAGPNVRRVGAGQLHLGAPDAPPGSAPSRHRHGAWVPRFRRVLRCGAFFVFSLFLCGRYFFSSCLGVVFRCCVPPSCCCFRAGSPWFAWVSASSAMGAVCIFHDVRTHEAHRVRMGFTC